MVGAAETIGVRVGLGVVGVISTVASDSSVGGLSAISLAEAYCDRLQALSAAAKSRSAKTSIFFDMIFCNPPNVIVLSNKLITGGLSLDGQPTHSLRLNDDRY